MDDTKKPLPRGFTPRDAQNRETDERMKQWMPPQMLPDPTPEPGFEFRWVRTSTLGADDPMNISAKLREGWEPVKASEHPELRLHGTNNNRFPDSIEVGGLMLCKTPAEFVQQRNAYYNGQANRQMESVDSSLMRENDPRMPLFNDRKTQVKSFGRGS